MLNFDVRKMDGVVLVKFIKTKHFFFLKAVYKFLAIEVTRICALIRIYRNAKLLGCAAQRSS